MDEEAPESSAWEQPRQPGQHRSICRLERRSLHLASEDRHLMAQHDHLDRKIRVAAAEETDGLEDAAESPVQEREGHRWMLSAPGPTVKVQHTGGG
ncbi:MAG: hypothetical protein KGQ66_19575 [Acidobacteriota bacterium]|nr:hypothetical protein [Acidobacteriota bacterium]